MEKFYESPHMVKQFKLNSKAIQALYNKEYILSIWKDHITLECPHKNPKDAANARNNLLLLHNFVFEYFETHIEKIIGIKTAESSEFQVILLDNRETPMSVISTLFTLCNMKKEFWGCTIYTSQKSTEYYKKYLDTFANIVHLDELDNISTFHIDQYNAIFKSTKFWKSMKASKCLVIQNDGFILREGVEEFLKFDYVGAPWVDVPEKSYLKNNVNSQMVGNGGLSLRSVSKMIEITEKCIDEKNFLFFHNINMLPEDVYFCKCLTKMVDSIMPSTAEASKFSSEELCHDNSIGVHRIWSYHSAEVVIKWFKSLI